MQQSLTKKTIIGTPSFNNHAQSPPHPQRIISNSPQGAVIPLPEHPTIWDGLASLQKRLQTLSQDEALMSRYSAHVVVLFLTVLVLTVSQFELPQRTLGTIQPYNPTVSESPRVISSEPEPVEALTLPSQLAPSSNGIFSRRAVPHIIAPSIPREEIAQYVIGAGDTVYGIAYKFNLAPETVLWANPVLEDNPHWLQVGQSINILPFDGIYHQVGGSDTIEGIAAAYKADPEAIISSPLNEIDAENPIVQIGQWVVVPGGSKPFVPPPVLSVVNYGISAAPDGAPIGTGNISWPVSGRISQGYFGYHPALDIEGPIGTPVLAIDSGFVAAAGWDDTGYGYHVVIDHGNGLQSLYAHLQSYYLNPGDTLSKGQAIGEIGMTGRTNGPHLHLEIRQGTIQLNPTNYLP
ncbi:LysM peptidoglycan-binding domain-containing M23 family metallopeptidase [Anaerolineales bacterium HSG24]|nr:LysM peptidoglycan-binding domain-containing M23 family metallopeptidase [Anaerolineales bacterium HSG24]